MWLGFARFTQSLAVIVMGAAVSARPAPAHAAVVPLGANWQAAWDPGLDGSVSITPISVSGDTIFISKSATFTQAPVNGQFPTIPIVFSQTGPSSIAHIVIEDETITNQTGVAWTGFQMDILDSGNAAFNPAMTAASGGPAPIGFSISPFTQASFTSDNVHLNISGGVLNSGQVWTPGAGPAGGQLWLNVVSQASAPFTVFTLKETPVPAPGTLALLGLAGFVIVPRSRRRR